MVSLLAHYQNRERVVPTRSRLQAGLSFAIQLPGHSILRVADDPPGGDGKRYAVRQDLCAIGGAKGISQQECRVPPGAVLGEGHV